MTAAELTLQPTALKPRLDPRACSRRARLAAVTRLKLGRGCHAGHGACESLRLCRRAAGWHAPRPAAAAQSESVLALPAPAAQVLWFAGLCRSTQTAASCGTDSPPSPQGAMGQALDIMRGKCAPLGRGTSRGKSRSPARRRGPTVRAYAPHISHYVKCPPAATGAAVKPLRGFCCWPLRVQPPPARAPHKTQAFCGDPAQAIGCARAAKPLRGFSACVLAAVLPSAPARGGSPKATATATAKSHSGLGSW